MKSNLMNQKKVYILCSINSELQSFACLTLKLLVIIMVNINRVFTMYSRSKRKKKTIYFNTNYHTEMKLVPIFID